MQERSALELHPRIGQPIPPVVSVRGNRPRPATALRPRFCAAPPGTVAVFAAARVRAQGTILPPLSSLPTPRPRPP